MAQGWQMIIDSNLAEVELVDGRYSDDWLVRTGEWVSTPDGLLKKNDGEEGGLLLRRPVVTGAIRIEYEAMSDNPGDMSLFLGTRPFVGNKPARAALFGVGSRGNTMNRISLPDGETVKRTDVKLVPGQWHRIVVERAAGRLCLEIDGKEIATAADTRLGFAGPHIMLYAYNEAVFRSITVWTRDDHALDDYLVDLAVKRARDWRGRPIASIPPPSKLLEAKRSPFNIVGRENIYKQLRSFDHRSMADDEFDAAVLDNIVRHDNADTAGAFYDAFVAAEHCTPPDSKADVEAADELLTNTFTFYNEKHHLGKDVNWEHNPGNDHWAHDLNRFSYLAVLCHAARETSDDRYYRKAVELILDWIDNTDVCDAPDWAGHKERSPYVWQSYLNIAIHLGRWTAHIDELAPHMSPHQLLVVMKSIHDQMFLLEAVIPTRVNNWVAIGGADMILVATRISELRGRERWIAFGWDQLKRTAEAQILPDGVQFELTPHYHLLVARLYATSLKSSKETGIGVPRWVEPAIEKMLNFSMQTVSPADTLLAFNDSDPKGGPEARRLLAEMGKMMILPDWLYFGTQGK